MGTDAFIPPVITQNSFTRFHMSDFGSAMPEQTLADKLNSSADSFVFDFRNSLGEGVLPPPELEVLSQARENGAGPSEIAVRTYELMIEQGMLYDVDPEKNILTPTQFNIKENLDDEVVKSEFLRLYKYGMALIQKGLIDVGVGKQIVTDRLINRTGLTPEEFDKWLGF